VGKSPKNFIYGVEYESLRIVWCNKLHVIQWINVACVNLVFAVLFSMFVITAILFLGFLIHIIIF